MKGRTIVVKCGGSAIADLQDRIDFFEAIAKVKKRGVRVVVVHGGGPQADELSAKLGIAARKVDGRRITDATALWAMKMVYAGSINTDLVAAATGTGVAAVGISGVAANLVLVRRRSPTRIPIAGGKTRTIDFGLVGDVLRINSRIVRTLLRDGFVPVIACLGTDGNGGVFNVNADTIATEIALAIRAERLVYVSDIAGVRVDASGNIARTLSRRAARRLILDGTISGGMLPKLENAFRALARGLPRVQIAGDLHGRSAWRDAVAGTCGTLIVI